MNIPYQDWADEEGIADEEMLSRLKGATDTAFEQLSDGIDPADLQRVEKSEAFTLFDKLLISLREDVTKATMNTLINAQMQRQQNAQMRQGNISQEERQRQAFQPQGGSKPAQAPAQPQGNPPMQHARSPMEMMNAAAATAAGGPVAASADADNYDLEGISRNSPCPCGSGKKVKHCHGKVS